MISPRLHGVFAVLLVVSLGCQRQSSDSGAQQSRRDAGDAPAFEGEDDFGESFSFDADGGRTAGRGSRNDSGSGTRSDLGAASSDPFGDSSDAGVRAVGAEAPSDGTSRATSGSNRLARSNSPYLLMHADNPVDWYPWGPEAFAEAKRLDRPVFLSVGYSSCFWCDVMERLVFSDPEIARYLNEHFVCVKVDREERPDVDEIYMTSLLVYQQAVGVDTGGGWPLSIFLTPDGKPFMGGTYFPPEPKGDRQGFPEFCRRVADLWQNRRAEVEDFSQVLTDTLERRLRPAEAQASNSFALERSVVSRAVDAVLEGYDSKHGGFGFDENRPDAPKFPSANRLALLQYDVRRNGDAEAEEALQHTLRTMADSGLYDQLAGGFHRYSTDRRWHVPHFEKMLYDQALLADVYVEAFRVTGRRAHRVVAEGVLDFVLRNMRDEDGGFYSALDAETNGVEGAYYVWTRDELQQVLDDREFQLFEGAYGIDQPAALEHGHVLHVAQPLEQVARAHSMLPEDLERRLAIACGRLLETRKRRQAPLLDDKILTAWNGLAIKAFARAGDVFARDDYVRAAESAAMFVLGHARDEDGRLRRSVRRGRAGHAGMLDDYACLVEGLLTLHEVTKNEKWHNAARRLTDDQIALFWDEQDHGFFYAPPGRQHLLVRTKRGFDDAVPSANAVSVRNLVRIASLSGEPSYREKAEQTLQAFAGDFERSPGGMATMAVALGEFLDDPDFRAGRGSPSPTKNRDVPEPFAFDDEPGPADTAAPATDPPPEIVQTGANDPADPSGRTDGDRTDAPEILSARAFLDHEKLPPGKQCRVVFYLDVKEGWHVNANPAKPRGMVPTTIRLQSRFGTELGNVEYPPPKTLKQEGIEQHVYDKRVPVYGVLDVPAKAAGRTEEIEIQIRYQACDDRRCLRPTTLRLRGKLPVGRAGERIRTVNDDKFPETRTR